MNDADRKRLEEIEARVLRIPAFRIGSKYAYMAGLVPEILWLIAQLRAAWEREERRDELPLLVKRAIMDWGPGPTTAKKTNDWAEYWLPHFYRAVELE